VSQLGGFYCIGPLELNCASHRSSFQPQRKRVYNSLVGLNEKLSCKGISSSSVLKVNPFLLSDARNGTVVMECPDKLKKYCQLDGEGDQIRTTTFRHRHLQPASCRLAAIFPVCAHTFHYRDGNNASINIYTAISSLHTR
jgi:hypothetical protein